MSTVLGGLLNQGVVLPLSGSLASATPTTFTGGVPDSFLAQAQILPSTVTLGSLSANFVSTSAMSLIGSTVTLTAQLYKVAYGTTTAVPVSLFTCDLQPALTGALAINTVSSCTINGLSGVFAAGDSGFVTVIPNVTAGIDTATSIQGSIAVGVGQ
jgi:hypothetical protein